MNKITAVNSLIPAGCRPAASGEGRAAVNIALCKYWGKRNAELNLPRTDSLSITLSPLQTETRISPAPEDALEFNGRALPEDDPAARRLFSFLDLFRSTNAAGFRVSTSSAVPPAAGLASSAAGFAALVRALDNLFGWGLDPRSLSIMARLGSGSAARSIYPGFVRWRAGRRKDGMDCYAVPLDIEWPNLRLALVTVSALAKPVSSREGMQRTAATSTLYDGWPRLVKDDMARLTEAIKSRDLDLLGSVAERNALAMHGTMLGADPPLIYWHPGTLETLQRVAGMRGDGCRLYATIDAGPNVKLLFEARDEDTIRHAFPGARVVAPFAHPETFTEPRDRPRIKYRSQPT